MTKTIIVSCGTAIATSTVAAKAIEEACKEAGIPVVTKQCKSAEIPIYLEQGADMIVTTSKLRFEVDIPVINGLPFLTGIGKDAVIEEIIGLLKE
jgi:PTS system galactitol-specific IIB component